MVNKLLVEAPSIAPAVKAGLLHRANIITDQADRAAYHGVQHEQVLGGHTRFVPAPGTDKTFDQLDYFDGVEFQVYRGIESALLIDAKPGTVAKDAFDGGESYAVEDAVQRLILNPSAVDLTPTPGTAVTNIRYALGLLEQYARSNYAGLPLIHGNLVAVTLIDGASLAGEGADLHTLHGTPISNGAGYGAAGPNSRTAGAGTAWLYVSGQVNLWQGKYALTEAQDLPGNRDYALAERPYAATVDGPVAAILVGI